MKWIENLDGRLRQVAAFVPPASRVADIGTDHGYLSIALVRDGRAVRMIAADKNEGPLEAARRTVTETGLAKKIELRLGDGLAVLAPGEVDVVILAGMGGELMAAILDAQPTIVDELHTLILQPMTDGDVLRRCLYGHGWHIEREALAETDGRIYEVICAVQGRKDCPAEIELDLGPCILQEQPPLFQVYLEGRIEKLDRIRRGMETSARARWSSRYREILEKIAAYETWRR